MQKQNYLPDNNIYYSTQTGPSPAPLLGNPLWRARKGWTANTSCEWLTLVCASWLQWARERHRMMKVVKAEQDPVSECWWSSWQFVLITGHNGQSLTRDGAPHALVSLTPDPDQGAWPESQSGGHRLLKSSHSSFSKTLFSVLFPPCYFKWMQKSR